jgi:hypothetical protein
MQDLVVLVVLVVGKVLVLEQLRVVVPVCVCVRAWVRACARVGARECMAVPPSLSACPVIFPPSLPPSLSPFLSSSHVPPMRNGKREREEGCERERATVRESGGVRERGMEPQMRMRAVCLRASVRTRAQGIIRVCACMCVRESESKRMCVCERERGRAYPT